MSRQVKNVLFIMFDQLRRDYLGCYGHEHLETPNIDRLASRGVRFDRAYIQSPLCGSSRMSTYTGRYVHSHGAYWNDVPLRVGELTLGDHLRKAGMASWLVGKTHMRADAEGMARLGLEPDSAIGARIAECGFDVYERDDGMRPEGPDGVYHEHGAVRYNDYLRDLGYPGDNPWHDYANSGIDSDDRALSGWFLKHSSEPANILEEHSETPYITRRGIEFMEQAEGPWLCHLSYIKPHWPYIVPAPYHDMYGAEHVQAVVRGEAERHTGHPILEAMQNSPVGRCFSRDDTREKVIPAYMGLIKQCDDQMGVLFRYLEESGRMDDTLIVLTSDHGDFLGDHWMGEKTFFYDASVRIPLIVHDPSPQADDTRGTVSDALVELIDLVPTFVDFAGGSPAWHILEGESLRPLLHGEDTDTTRDVVICEYDYSALPMLKMLKVDPEQALMFMIATREWKMVHFEGGFAPILFDLVNDPDELVDVAGDPANAAVITEMLDKLGRWARRPSQRVTFSPSQAQGLFESVRRKGVVIGTFDEEDGTPELIARYRDVAVERKIPARDRRKD